MSFLAFKWRRYWIAGCCLLFVGYWLLATSNLYGGNQNPDGLERANRLVIETDSLYRTSDFDRALELSGSAIEACESIGSLDGIALVLNIVANIYRIKGDYGKALNNFFVSLEHFQNLDNQRGQAITLNYIGSVYRLQGNYPGALQYLLRSLQIYQQLSDKDGEAQIFNNIGIVYFYQMDYEKALEFYKKSLEIELELNNEEGVGTSYINIGEIHHHKGEHQLALDFYLKALVISKKHNDQDGVGVLYKEIGTTYTNLGNLQIAGEYLQMALEIFQNLHNIYRIAECYIAIGNLQLQEGHYNAAISSFQEGLQLAETSHSLELVAEGHKNLSQAFELKRNTQQSFSHFKQYISTRDSLFNEENTKKTVQAEMLFDFERQMSEANIEQARKNAIAEAEARRGILLRNILLMALTSLIIVVYLISTAYKSKKRANEQLAIKQTEVVEKNEELLQQQEEILSQRDEIEKKNQTLEMAQKEIEAQNERIISSIEYAQSIQQAVLPNEEDLKENFSDYMVFYLPKDIVSGDFFWFSTLDNLKFIAVVDCTGHGVPGSFMSLIGNIILNQVVNIWQTLDPEQILQLAHNQIRKVLKQDQSYEKTNASMDVCFITIDTASKKAIFTGARRPLYIIQNGNFRRISGDPRPVGGVQLEKQREFTKHYIDLSEPTWLYLTTDGFIDQMDNQSRKYGTRRLASLLQDIHLKPMEQQKEALQTAFNNHMGNCEQIDDVCVLGLKI